MQKSGTSSVSSYACLLRTFYNDLNDLMDNGYLFLFDSVINGVQFIKVRHVRNGRMLSLSLSDKEWSIMEDGVIIKKVKLSE